MQVVNHLVKNILMRFMLKIVANKIHFCG